MYGKSKCKKRGTSNDNVLVIYNTTLKELIETKKRNIYYSRESFEKMGIEQKQRSRTK